MERAFHIKSITMIDPVNGWFEITKYGKNKATMIANLVKTTWLVQFPRPVEIMYD